MSKVFLVWKGVDCEEAHVRAIFTDEERARAYAHPYGFRVEGFDVDAAVSDAPEGKRSYFLAMDLNSGKITSLGVNDEPPTRPFLVSAPSPFYPLRLHATFWARDDEDARRIARELRLTELERRARE